MDMVFGNVTLENLNIHTFADLSDQIPQPLRCIANQNRLAIFRDPNKVVLDVIYYVGNLAVIFNNTLSLLRRGIFSHSPMVTLNAGVIGIERFIG